MSITKKFLVACLSLWLGLASSGALTSDNPPINLFTTGFNTAAGATCALTVGGADGYTVLLDASALATSTITVSIGVWDPGTSAWVVPATIAGTSNHITVTNAVSQVFNFPGGYPGLQVSVVSFGTATGTFNASISAY